MVTKLALVCVCLLSLVGCSPKQDKTALIRYSKPIAGEAILPDVEDVAKDISLYAQLSDTIPASYTLHSAEWIKEAIENREEGSWKLDELPSFVEDVQTILSAIGSDFIYTQTTDGWAYVDTENEDYKLMVIRTSDNAVFVYTV